MHEPVRRQLRKILSSQPFVRSPRLSRFLTFIVEQKLAGEDHKLKEYMLGIEVFNRHDTFDPRIDSIVRVEARRLRVKLERYYETEGRDDSVVIIIHKGSYVPSFANRPDIERLQAGLDAPYQESNPRAFAFCAKGRLHLEAWTASSIRESIECFGQAIAEDPESAGAHAGLATAWALSAFAGTMPASDAFENARHSANAALQRHANSVEALSIEGVVNAFLDPDWTVADSRFRRALAINPSDCPARLWYGASALLTGHSNDARREALRVRNTAPTSLAGHLLSGLIRHLAGEKSEALEHYRLAVELYPNSWTAHLAMALLLATDEKPEEARASITRAAEIEPREPMVLAARAYVEGSAGRAEEARRALEQLREAAGQQHVAPLALAVAQAYAGDADEARQALEQARASRTPWLGLLPLFAALGESPAEAEPAGPQMEEAAQAAAQHAGPPEPETPSES